MRLSLEARGEVRIVRVGEAKLTYPVLSSFLAAVSEVVEGGARQLVIDLTAVTYIESATIGCLMDIYRLLEGRGGAVRLSGLQPRVEMMLSMTGVHKIVGVHREEAEALAAFGRVPGQNGPVPSRVAGAASAARSLVGAKIAEAPEAP